MVTKLIRECEESLAPLFRKVEETAYFNQVKVLKAFNENRIALRHFAGSTGYGYGDDGRDTLNRVYADVFGAEDALVSPALLSGTHALTVALFGLVFPGDKVLCITGEPYDTMRSVVSGEGIGSLKDYHISFESVALNSDNKMDYGAIRQALNDQNIKVVYIQRSRGYEWRDAFSVDEIGNACAFLRDCGFNGCIFVDNCYGEFVETKEPTEVGADIIVGSLIKNPGGGLAPTGGYVAGTKKYVEKIANRLTAPSIGAEIGSYAYGYQYFYQGFFMAPHTVEQAIKGSLLIGKAMESLGYVNSPATDVLPCDITRAIRFDTEKQLTSFIQSVQEASPIDSFLTLEAWDMPGYENKVIMAAGCFVQGSSVELSADAPIREPYTAYFQGGLTYEHCKYALSVMLEKLM